MADISIPLQLSALIPTGLPVSSHQRGMRAEICLGGTE
jgi:hypothetical protein